MSRFRTGPFTYARKKSAFVTALPQIETGPTEASGPHHRDVTKAPPSLMRPHHQRDKGSGQSALTGVAELFEKAAKRNA